MIKNRLTQIIFQVVYCTLSLFGILGSLGYFDASYNYDCFLYYTNLSNYICMGFMVIALINTIKRSKQDNTVDVAPTFNFLCVIMILVTCVVYNVLLAKEYSVAHYFLTIQNLLLHLILPIMFILHWVLFCEHGKLRWYHPLLCLIMPLIYVTIILIRSLFVRGQSNTLVYPYFFLNVDNLGWGGVFAYIAVLLIIFVAIGYIFYFFDNLQTIQKKIRKQNKINKQ